MSLRQQLRLVPRWILAPVLALGVLVPAFDASATALPQGVTGTLSAAGHGGLQGHLEIEPLDSATPMYGGYSMSSNETPGQCQYPCLFFDTAIDGSFNVPLAPGRYWIRFVALAPAAWAPEWWGNAPRRVGSEVTISAGAYTNHDEELQPGGSIGGTITQAVGDHDALVEAWVADATFPGGYFLMKSVWADVNGDYVVPHLPDAAYRLHFVNRLTKLEGWWHTKDTVEAADDVTIAAESNVSAIDPELTPFGSFSGRVLRAADGTPAAGVTINALRQTEPFHWTQEADQAVSASDGTYTLPVRSGTYRVRFSGGTGLKDDYWQGSLNVPGGSDAVVAIGKQTTDVDEALEPVAVINKTAPTVYGTQRVGHTITATNGTWYPAATGYTYDFKYQWTRGGVVIGYGKTYTLRTPDYGRRLRVRVTASRGGYESTTAYAQTGVIAKGTFKLVSRPKLYGSRTVGSSLYVLDLISSPTASLHYRWYRDGHRIPGATSSRYRLVAADRGHRIAVRITLSRYAYSTLVLRIQTASPIR